MDLKIEDPKDNYSDNIDDDNFQIDENKYYLDNC